METALECEIKLFPEDISRWFFGDNEGKIHYKPSKPKEILQKKSSDDLLKDNLKMDNIISMVLEKEEKKGNIVILSADVTRQKIYK